MLCIEVRIYEEDGSLDMRKFAVLVPFYGQDGSSTTTPHRKKDNYADKGDAQEVGRRNEH